MVGGQSVTLDSLFKSNGCFSLIELDEVFDRKSIKRDGAARQLQSAEGSRTGGFILYFRRRMENEKKPIFCHNSCY